MDDTLSCFSTEKASDHICCVVKFIMLYTGIVHMQDCDINLNPSINVNFRLPYDLYMSAKEYGINLSEAARAGVKKALGMSE